MSEQQGRCRAEMEQVFGSRELPSRFELLVDAIDRIESRLDAESTAGQAARQTAERLIVAERDEWRRRAEAAERELATARAMEDRYRVRRFPEEKPEGEFVLHHWQATYCWILCAAANLCHGDLWCYAPPPPDSKKNTPEILTTPDAAPAATIDAQELMCELHHIAGSEQHHPDVRRTASDAESAIARLIDWVHQLQVNAAEREAIEWASKTLCVGWHDLAPCDKERTRATAVTLRGLLERLGGGE